MLTTENITSILFAGSAWEIFDIVSVEKYYVEPEDETPFFQTGAGVAIIVLIVLLLVAAIAVGVIFLLRKAKKHNWYRAFCFISLKPYI